MIICRRGHVAMIPDTTEFFIAAMDHPEWGTAHSVWGEVMQPASTATLNKILQQPFQENKHPQYGTIMRMLQTPVPFKLKAVQRAIST